MTIQQAAIILTASITFLALPGLDQVGRSAGFVTVAISAASLLSSILAAFRNQVEVQRIAARGGEGFVVTMDGVNVRMLFLSPLLDQQLTYHILLDAFHIL